VEPVSKRNGDGVGIGRRDVEHADLRAVDARP
jgi:hypothetical protein